MTSITKVKVVTDEDYLPSLLQQISKARKSIDLMSFSFAIGSASGKINEKKSPFKVALKIKEVIEKKNIKVRFFSEGERETYERNKVTADFLKDAGATVRFGSTHAKGICIDNEVVLFGSTNLTHQSLTKNTEANLLIKEDAVSSQFKKYFDHLWKGGKHGEISLKKPLLPDGAFEKAMIDSINQAQSRIDFAIYFFDHKGIEKALVSAHERGVKVSGFIHQHKFFALPYINRNLATVKRLREAGITDLTLGPVHTFSHSKYMIIDKKKVILGTGNWLSEDVHIHPQLYIAFKNPGTAKALLKHLDGLHAQE